MSITMSINLQVTCYILKSRLQSFIDDSTNDSKNISHTIEKPDIYYHRTIKHLAEIIIKNKLIQTISILI